MSSFRNAVPRRTHKERTQPQARKKIGFLERHKDYVHRAHAFHTKEETLRKLREKASFKNPDEFYFKMIKTKLVNGVHRAENEANKFTAEELLLMKTQDIGYVLQQFQREKKKLEKLKASLHFLDNQPSDRHVYFAEDSEEAEEIQSTCMKSAESDVHITTPRKIKRKTDASYRLVRERTEKVNVWKRLYMEMSLKKELQKKSSKHKLQEDEFTKPVYKWRTERKR